METEMETDLETETRNFKKIDLLTMSRNLSKRPDSLLNTYIFINISLIS